MPANTPMVCPECGEPAVPHRPAVPAVAGRDDGTWSHRDGQPLCPVIGPHGYQPADPVAARRTARAA
ncbi:hypothetical protein I6A60_38635 [Frankia sp. AgB1.9]|uniref:hypothetical protein n=1 Tax=unclassified Frankia TaxID=2632575 RepID=UPI00193408B6|nr:MULTISPECIES: hypothetical protein [unclassified Frankia]MBL7491178.1 hypothetical protein [Frankia sp. AgW1.1]MBL7553707.1 hypothetical protein [Frankia sp. AgB1.9]MBL7618001.1 hypothetical protein [Frankia sp. AgB1.8]